ncbi:hypothetical protein [Streptomyces sp. G45]|uniref:hypothetical protein n=1 Tax=Streptomyces sp. G45 TaxID=3406627 RepID=UPI003C1CC877
MMTADPTPLEDLLDRAFAACSELPSPEVTAVVRRRLVEEILRRVPRAEQAAAGRFRVRLVPPRPG